MCQNIIKFWLKKLIISLLLWHDIICPTIIPIFNLIIHSNNLNSLMKLRHWNTIQVVKRQYLNLHESSRVISIPTIYSKCDNSLLHDMMLPKTVNLTSSILYLLYSLFTFGAACLRFVIFGISPFRVVKI